MLKWSTCSESTVLYLLPTPIMSPKKVTTPREIWLLGMKAPTQAGILLYPQTLLHPGFLACAQQAGWATNAQCHGAAVLLLPGSSRSTCNVASQGSTDKLLWKIPVLLSEGLRSDKQARGTDWSVCVFSETLRDTAPKIPTVDSLKVIQASTSCTLLFIQSPTTDAHFILNNIHVSQIRKVTHTFIFFIFHWYRMNTKFLESYKMSTTFIKKASKCVTLQRHENTCRNWHKNSIFRVMK